MKILYIYTSAGIKNDSVQSKIIDQITALNNVGVECEGAFFSFDVDESHRLNDKITLLPVRKRNFTKFRSRLRILQIKAALQYIQSVKDTYDFIYFRYPSAGYTLWNISRILRDKVFFEHLCIEINEIKLHSKETPFVLRPSVILSHLEYLWLPFIKESVFGPFIRKNALFGLCNSKEIAKWQSTHACGSYKTYINGDAVNSKNFQIKKMNLADQLNLLFLKGASGSAIYNGLDRLIAGMAAYKGGINIKLHILGNYSNYEEDLVKKYQQEDNVIIKDRMSGEQLDAYIDNMHIGISALAVHRKGLKETTTIKSREYFARGLPFIYGYYDPDIDELEKLGYTLRIDPDDSIIDINKVIQFWSKVSDNKNYSEEMHTLAHDKLDFDVKAFRIKKILEQYS